MLQLAEHILETKTADFNPAAFVDRYEEAVVEMLKKKQDGMVTEKPRPVERAPNVINLMDALRRSISQGGETSTKAGKAAAPAKGRKAKGSKPEDLRNAPQFKFPIAGGKAKAKEERAAAVEAPKSKSRRKSA